MKLNYFDLHCDTATAILGRRGFAEKKGHINALALASFSKAVQCFAVYINDANKELGMDFFRSVAANLKNEIADVPNLTAILTTEGGNVIEGDVANLSELSEYGVKIFGFVWNGRNALATGALCDNAEGLTEAGKEAAKKIESLGIYPDVSHLSDRGFFDLENIYGGPIIATHSNARSVFEHPRNLTDEQLKVIFERKGLVGLNLYPKIICENPKAEDLLPHAEKMLSLGGEDCVCMGCDFDGVSSLPEGIHDVSDITVIYNIFRENFGKDIAEKILWRNAARFFRMEE